MFLSLLASYTSTAQITISTTNANPCNGKATVTVPNAASGFNFEYAIDGGAYKASNTFENLKPDRYLASVKDKNTQCVFSKEFIIQALPDPNVNSESSTASPTLEVPGNVTYCNNTPASALIFNSNVCYAQFTWTSNANAGFGGGGIGKILPFIATNTTNAPIVATVKVIATANGKTSPEKTFTVTVNPTPSVNAIPANQIICSGVAINAISISNPNNVAGTTFSWVRDNTTNVTGMPPTGTGASITGTLTNTTKCAQITTFSITASANGCSSPPVTVKVTVNPAPAVNAIANLKYCNNATGASIKFGSNVDGATFSWTSTGNIDVGFGTSGTGNIPEFKAKNTTNGPITATINVKATANGCESPVKTFTVLVNPTPTLNAAAASQTVCSGVPITNINNTNTNTVAGTTFSWERDNTTNLTGIAANGTGANIAGTFTNTTSAVQAAAFTIVASANSCLSTPATAIVIVNPAPDIKAEPVTQTINSGKAIDEIKITNPNNLTGVTFSWTRDNTTRLTGIPASGTGTSITGKLTNTTAAIQTTTFSITATAANGCTGKANVTINVDPPKKVPAPITSFDRDALNTGIAADNFKVSVSPNPTSGNFTLNVQSAGDGPITVKVIDATGRLVATYSTAKNNFTFGNDLVKGVYYVHIIKGNNHETIKVIKSN